MTTIDKLLAIVAVGLFCYGPQAFAQFHDPRALDSDPLTATEQIAFPGNNRQRRVSVFLQSGTAVDVRLQSL